MRRRRQFGWPTSRPGQVRLVQFAGRILHLEPTRADGRPREEAHHRFEGRLLGRLRFGQELFRRERVGELQHVGAPRGAFPVGGAAVEEAEGFAQVDVEAAPPAAEGRQIVGREVARAERG